jgi:hypothetical protein
VSPWMSLAPSNVVSRDSPRSRCRTGPGREKVPVRRGGAYSTWKTASKMRVTMADTAREPRQPSRLEKNKNLGISHFCWLWRSIVPARTPWPAGSPLSAWAVRRGDPRWPDREPADGVSVRACPGLDDGHRPSLRPQLHVVPEHDQVVGQVRDDGDDHERPGGLHGHHHAHALPGEPLRERVGNVTPAGPRAARAGWPGGARRSARVRPMPRPRASSSGRNRLRDRNHYHRGG